jgi:hypothetical protein
MGESSGRCDKGSRSCVLCMAIWACHCVPPVCLRLSMQAPAMSSTPVCIRAKTIDAAWNHVHLDMRRRDLAYNESFSRINWANFVHLQVSSDASTWPMVRGSRKAAPCSWSTWTTSSALMW